MLCLLPLLRIDLRQNVFQYQKGVLVAISIVMFQICEHFLQFCGVYFGFDLLLIGGQNRIFFCPHLCPVDLLLGLFTRVLDDLFNFLHLDIKVNKLIQSHMIQQG